jgi:UDP-N-acetylglucosamine acyltransferase
VINLSAFIHKNSYIANDAIVHENVYIGEKCTIGNNVEIGQNTIICKNTILGNNTKIYPNSYIGGDPQDKNYNNDDTYLKIGENNIIREFVSIHRGASKEDQTTYIGNNCYIMCNAHIGHNCRVGNNVIITSYTGLSGHVIVDDFANISGFVAVHQFVRIGKYAMVGGMSRIVQDVIPFAIVEGNPARLRGLNVVGLKRNNFENKKIALLRNVIKLFMKRKYTIKEIISMLDRYEYFPEVEYMRMFLSDSKRGYTRK